MTNLLMARVTLLNCTWSLSIESILTCTGPSAQKLARKTPLDLVSLFPNAGTTLF